MTKCYAIGITLALSGCVSYTPTAMVAERTPQMFTLKMTPAEAAKCVRGNIERKNPVLSAEIRDDNTVIGRAGGASTQTVVKFEPSGTGSQARVWMAPMLHQADEWARDFVKGC